MSIRLGLFAIFCAWVIRKAFTERPIYLVMLLVFIYFTYPEKYIWGLEEYRIVFLLNVVLMLCLLKHGKKLLSLEEGQIYSVLMIGLFFSVLVSALNAKGVSELSLGYAFLFFKVVFFWFLLRASLEDEKAIALFFWTCLLSIVFLSGWGIEQYIRGNVRLENFGGGQIMGSNQIAAAMVWAFPIAYFNILKYEGHLRLLSLTCLIIILGGIVCTQSRQAVVAILFCIPWYYAYMKRKSLFVLISLFVILMGAFWVPQDFFERMETISEYEEDTSAQGRIEQWKGAYEMFLDYPLLGVGGRNYYVLADQYVEYPRVTHNTYFQILAEEGAVGFMLFTIMLIVVIVRMGRLAKWHKDPDKPSWISHYAIIVKMNMIGIMVICIFQNKAEHEFLYWPIAVAAALEWHASKMKKKKNEEDDANELEISTHEELYPGQVQ